MKINVKNITGPPLYRVELEMTQEEINFFKCVVGSVSGDHRGPRQVTEAIYRALSEAGAESTVLFENNLSAPDNWDAFHEKMKDA